MVVGSVESWLVGHAQTVSQSKLWPGCPCSIPLSAENPAKIVTKRRPRRPPPRCSTQRAGIAPPHAEGDGLSGATSDGEFGFISGPAAFVGGVPLTRAMNPWAMPEASV